MSATRRARAVVTRRFLLALPWLVVVASACAAPAGRPRVAPRVAPDVETTSSEAVAVMSFNIRHGRGADGEHVWPNRRAIVQQLVRESGASLIGLQEVLDFQLAEMREALPTHRAIGVGRDDGVAAGEFAPLLVDTTRFAVVTSGTFWFSDTPDVPGSMHWGNRITRIASWARLADRRTGDTLRVYNVHWDHESQPSRERSASLLRSRLAGDGSPLDALLVTGDFNAGEDNAAFQALVDSAPRGATARVRLRDSYRVRYPDARVVGTFNAFRGDSTGDKIDAILIDPLWHVETATIDRTRVGSLWPSDHFPVTARLWRTRAIP
ncbi:MAG: endonuclease/exonuclease/phosphatase family protein [Gemmatimonadaceae bacterium]|jgi:endonuclease/exonuclease/phosphatase family metal-dependent hydrolase|nr:endonuclease/exonuclease/phosphatase family protein [Gemmatimonadaceae bacterium]